MPDAYENFTTYTLDMHRVPSISPVTPGEQESFFLYNNDPQMMSTLGVYSPHSMESSPIDDSMSTQEIFRNPMDYIAEESSIRGKCEIKILVQPVDKFRFRYKSEMSGTHGSLYGEREETGHKKEVPTVQLVNCPHNVAVIRCTLVTVDDGRRYPHAHHLVRKNGIGDEDDPHDIKVYSENNYTAMFYNMGIIHTAKKNIKEEILRKRKIEILEEKKRINFQKATISTREELNLKMEAEKAQKWMNLNSVALCFQGFYYGSNNVLYPLTDKIYSRPINNLKSALTGELKICRIDKHTGSVEGNEEVWILVEKVGKKNIKVKFYEIDDDDNILWEADGRFSELDVHHQFAIVFRTPPYKDLTIEKPKEVVIKLERPTDGEVSNCMSFVYKPSDRVLNRKRRRLSSKSQELTQNTSTSTPLSYIPNAETVMNFADDISNLSGELKKLLNENDKVNSEDLKAFLNDNSSLEKYLNLITPLASPLSDNIACDGASEMENTQTNFANDILRKVTNILKELESQNISKQAAIAKIESLLKELTNYRDTPLHNAIRHEQYETAKYILMILSTDVSFKSIANIQNSCGKTPLHLAILQNQPDIVRALLKLGADPNICDKEDHTSLHNAVLVNANACLDELLNSGIKLNLEAHTESGWSALHLAAEVGSMYAVQALDAAGADVNAIDMSYGRTALHIAVESNHKHIVNYLLTKTNIDVNMKNFGGNTALHSAVVKGGTCAKELIKILKKHGADPMIRNNNVQDVNEEQEINNPKSTYVVGSSTTSSIKSETSDTDDEVTLRPGESSFDLAQDDPKLMEILRGQNLNETMEELQLKEELDDEPMLRDHSMLEFDSTAKPCINSSQRPAVPMTRIPSQLHMKFVNQSVPNQQPQKHPKMPEFGPGHEPLTEEHVNRIKPILDKTGDWEKLAHHTNQGSLVRLYKKLSSPSAALLGKIKLQRPNISVSQLKKLLIEIKAYEAALLLEKS